MVQVVIIEGQPLLRLGLAALMGCITSNDQIKIQSYDCLYRSPPATTPCRLVLLSARPDERINLLIQAVRRVHSPRRIVLLSETPAVPPSWTNLPSVVTTYISTATNPEEILQTIHPLLLSRQGYRPPARQHLTLPKQVPEDIQTVPPTFQLQAQPSRRAPAYGIEIDEARMLGITPRQYEVLVLLSRGYPIKVICRHLNISPATTKGHSEALYQRLGVHNRNEAVFTAMAQGATLLMNSASEQQA